MKLTVHQYGDPVLRQKAEYIKEINETIRILARDMVKTMRAANGVGLAAEQVGKTVSLCVVELPAVMDCNEDGVPNNPYIPMPLTLINPVILHAGKETTIREEGCLSFPDIVGKIERPWSVTVRYKDLSGQYHEQAFHGMLARVVQHEIDHLNGVLFIDRMSHAKRLALKGRLKRLRQETEEQLCPT